MSGNDRVGKRTVYQGHDVEQANSTKLESCDCGCDTHSLLLLNNAGVPFAVGHLGSLDLIDLGMDMVRAGQERAKALGLVGRS